MLDPAKRTARKLHPELMVDVSAIAPGYAVDRIVEALEALGHQNLLVEIGGEIRVRGTNAAGQPWQLAIEQPRRLERRVHVILPVRDLSLATSGNYRNVFEAGGVAYAHALDPRTGRPTTHRLASVSVLQPRCSAADAWATALLVLGPAEGPALAARLGIPALFLITRGDDGGFDERRSPAFELLFPGR
jgi:thiamine biosynthesis lipoprotein